MSEEIHFEGGEYRVREQSFDEIHRPRELPFELCGVNPYGYFRHIRRFVAERKGQIVGEGWTMASRHNPWGELGHYAVFSPEHRRKGLGGRLLELCIEALRRAGMEAMFIDTGPSIAHRVYEKRGFCDLVPGHPEWMGQCFTGSSIRQYMERYFEIGEQKLEVRPLDFDHLIEIRALLNAAVDPDFLIKSYLLTLFCDDQLHEGQILVEIPAFSSSGYAPRQVRMLGLFAGPGLIGFSTLAPWRLSQWDNRHEAHLGLWDLYLHPPLWSRERCALILEEIRRAAAAMKLSRLRVLETPRPTLKTRILQELGFAQSFVMPGAALLGSGSPERGRYPGRSIEDLAAYEMELGPPPPYIHPYRIPWDY